MASGRLSLRDSELDWREVEGQVLALDLRESRYLLVNETGRALWAVLRKGATEAELVGHLTEAYGIDPERAMADVSAFIAELDARDLIVRGEPRGG